MKVMSRNNFKVETVKQLSDHEKSEERRRQEHANFYQYIARTNPKELGCESFVRSLEAAVAKLKK